MSKRLAYTPPEHLLRDFASRGLVVLAPESLGVPAEIHAEIYRKEKRALSAKEKITAASIPEILQIVNAPGVAAACDQLLGKHWAVVPFTHNAPFASGAYDQHWHKDDNSPLNGRKQRHHHAIQVEMLYYPQAVAEDMGPTATVPYSQYWAFNHEENHDNFAGADHLDFEYYLSGMEREPASGPNSRYQEADIRVGDTRHDIRLREAVTGIGWPLVRQFEAAPLEAGSVVLYSHNLFHRGNHRRDDWCAWKLKPRFLWRFWLYRTTEPKRRGSGAVAPEVDWHRLGVDPMTGHNLADAPEDATAVWCHHYHWLQGGPSKPSAPAPCSATERQRRGQALFNALHAKHDAGEPTRIGAAYQLAAIGDDELAAGLLAEALRNERETVRRAATYGLVALGTPATEVLLEASRSPVKWVRKAAVFALGDAGEPDLRVAEAIAKRLREDASVYVRSVAAGALGCLGRRAIAAGVGDDIVPSCFEALIASLRLEENRLGMNVAQKRSIKIVRPTDECDVCEGIGTNQGVARFAPVRSAVRENALWSAVILCSHGSALLGAMLDAVVETLAGVVHEDDNIFSVGLALDALNRLARLHQHDRSDVSTRAAERFDTLLAQMPIHSWDSLLRGGYPEQSALRRSTQTPT